jgi:hypothetical protein
LPYSCTISLDVLLMDVDDVWYADIEVTKGCQDLLINRVDWLSRKDCSP